MIVKVCGMRDAVNIREVERAGADWIGFICYERSPRFIDRVPEYLPQKVVRVGVFVNAAPEVCLRQAEALALHAVQLHGMESPDCCDRLRKSGLKVVKAFAIHRAEELQITEPYAGVCDYFLFDTPCLQYGGSGRSFDWSVLEHYRGSTPFLLSGGIRPESMEALKAFRHPRWEGIDLNSGFESAPGMKDAQTLARFIAEFKKTTSINPLNTSAL